MGLRGPRAKNKPAPKSRLRDKYDKIESKPEAIKAFLEDLTITSGIKLGEKFEVYDFEDEIIDAWYSTDEAGHRIVRTGLFTVGRKNGKTGLISGLVLAHLVGPVREPRGQIVVGATDRDQSAIVFNEVVAYIETIPEYSAICNVKRHEKKIENLENGTEFIALSSDAKKAHGLSPSVVILDELAQWGTGIGRKLYDALTTSQGARKEPLLIIIGTQSADDHSIMSNLVDYTKAVNRGDIDDPTFRGFVYEIPEDLDVFDEANWHLANPALDLFRSREDMRLLAERAKKIPTLEATFRNLFCNQRIDAEERWLPPAEWKPCIDDTIDLDALVGEYCVGGLDLSSVRDLTAFALFWPESNVLNVWTFCPEENLYLREERDRVPYTVWAKQGYITPTPGSAINKKFIGYQLEDLCMKFKPSCIAFDRWGIAELTQTIKEEGIVLSDNDDIFVDFGQGFKSMSPATKAFEAKVIDRILRTPPNPVLTWAVSNAAVSRDAADNKKLNKDKSRERIDPAIAAVMAVGQAVISEDDAISYTGLKTVSA
jgi:phage terminase large subunit-like protein